MHPAGWTELGKTCSAINVGSALALSAGRFGLCGFRPSCRLKLTAVSQDRPGRARCLVRNRDSRDIGRPPHQKPGQPAPALPMPSGERSGPMDQQCADIAVAAFADPTENLTIAARTLSWYKPEPSREVTTGSKALGVIHREDKRACGHDPHAGDRQQSPAGIRLLCPGFKSLFVKAPERKSLTEAAGQSGCAGVKL